ncbi:MAG: NAD-dependent deacylase [Thermoplasmata archaeon]|nr:NAD-dependent deacylase [Thermoplasmata archaeon]
MQGVSTTLTKTKDVVDSVSDIEILKTARHVVVLTGAGISAESLIPTFRGKGGLWEKYDIEEYATAEAVRFHPEKVWELHNELRALISQNKPNPAHYTIVEMEKHFPKFALITQNIDNYHQEAGSAGVIELHGNVWRDKCTKEGTITINKELPIKNFPPKCKSCGAIIRPDVVFFNEPLDTVVLGNAFQAVELCDLMFVVGTSVVVQPAASLPFIAKQNNAYLIEVNIEPTSVTYIADKSYFGKAGEVLPKLWDEFLSGK